MRVEYTEQEVLDLIREDLENRGFEGITEVGICLAKKTRRDDVGYGTQTDVVFEKAYGEITDGILKTRKAEPYKPQKKKGFYGYDAAYLLMQTGHTLYNDEVSQAGYVIMEGVLCEILIDTFMIVRGEELDILKKSKGWYYYE